MCSRMVDLLKQNKQLWGFSSLLHPPHQNHILSLYRPFFTCSLACGIRSIEQSGGTAWPKHTNQGAAAVHRSERGEFTFFLKLKAHIGGPQLLWDWRGGQISKDLMRNTWNTPENQPYFSPICIRTALVLVWEKKIQSTTWKHETFVHEHMRSLRFGGFVAIRSMCFFNASLSLFGFGGLILIQKKHSRNCHPHFSLDCCVAFAKLSLFQQKTPQSTEGVPFWHVITDSLLTLL